MRQQLNRKIVVIELLEPEPIIITIKPKRFVKAKVLSVGTEVTKDLKADDIVMVYNEGRTFDVDGKRIRLIADYGIALKYL